MSIECLFASTLSVPETKTVNLQTEQIHPVYPLVFEISMWYSLDLTFLFLKGLPYVFAYKTVFFSFQNNPKNLDPSYQMDLDLWDCLGRVKPVLQQHCIGLVWKPCLIAE